MFDIEKAKQEARPWPFQDVLDRLVASGFAEVDERQTYRWFNENGKKLMYKFTEAGKAACFRNRYSLPMAWAEDIQKGARHCVVCGRDLYRMKVWEQEKGKPGCICLSCSRKGHRLQDIATQK